jgi:hypothetical protein
MGSNQDLPGATYHLFGVSMCPAFMTCGIATPCSVWGLHHRSSDWHPPPQHAAKGVAACSGTFPKTRLSAEQKLLGCAHVLGYPLCLMPPPLLAAALQLCHDQGCEGRAGPAARRHHLCDSGGCHVLCACMAAQACHHYVPSCDLQAVVSTAQRLRGLVFNATLSNPRRCS